MREVYEFRNRLDADNVAKLHMRERGGSARVSDFWLGSQQRFRVHVQVRGTSWALTRGEVLSLYTPEQEA